MLPAGTLRLDASVVSAIADQPHSASLVLVLSHVWARGEEVTAGVAAPLVALLLHTTAEIPFFSTGPINA